MSKWTIWTAIAILGSFVTILISAQNSRAVTIDEKHFSCTATEPFGIEARCTQYTWVKGVK